MAASVGRGSRGAGPGDRLRLAGQGRQQHRRQAKREPSDHEYSLPFGPSFGEPFCPRRQQRQGASWPHRLGWVQRAGHGRRIGSDARSRRARQAWKWKSPAHGRARFPLPEDSPLSAFSPGHPLVAADELFVQTDTSWKLNNFRLWGPPLVSPGNLAAEPTSEKASAHAACWQHEPMAIRLRLVPA
jgi:hypothetical protein